MIDVSENMLKTSEEICKRKDKENPITFFLLINIHHLFYDKNVRDYLKSPMTVSQIAGLIYKKTNRPDVYYLLKYLIDVGVMKLVKNKLSEIDDRKLYIIDKKLLKKEIDSWCITKKLVDTYLYDCGVGVILEK